MPPGDFSLHHLAIARLARNERCPVELASGFFPAALPSPASGS